MRRRKNIYLGSNVANQYPIEKLKNIIFDVVDIVDSFILDFGEEENLNSSSISVNKHFIINKKMQLFQNLM